MPSSSQPNLPEPAGRRALFLYVVAWAAAGIAVAVLLLTLLRRDDEQVSVAPVEETELAVAARRGGCELRTGRRNAGLRPPVAGPRARPVAAGIYRTDQPESHLVGALRRGIVVIHYRPGLVEDRVDELHDLQRAQPRGTIVAPNARMPYALATTAWGRLLGCRAVGDETIDAVQLFRGRFVGGGPDSPP
jgi:hypothetical protein